MDLWHLRLEMVSLFYLDISGLTSIHSFKIGDFYLHYQRRDPGSLMVCDFDNGLKTVPPVRWKKVRCATVFAKKKRDSP